MDNRFLIVFQIIFFNQFLGTLQQNMQRLKGDQADFESDVLTRIAEGKKTERGDLDALPGALDEEYGDDDEDYRTEDNDDDNGDDEALVDSFLVQRLHNATEDAPTKPPVTTYHSFDDPSYRSPLFTRSGEDYKADFIIFANPSFPPGTGHYVVLRRLEAPNEPFNYDIDDDLSAEDKDDYGKGHDYDDEYEGFMHQMHEGMDEGLDPRTPEPAGRVQSGEENYADTENAGPKADGIGNDNFDESDDPLIPKSPYQTKIKHRSSMKNTEDDDPSPQQGEIIYEAFSINFKGSLQGYISDMDPLQYSFLNNEEDPVESLMEDENNLLPEGDDDDDTEEEEADANNGNIVNNMQDNMDMNSDKDLMDFQSSIRQDAGMMSSGGEALNPSEGESVEAAESRRKKRSIFATIRQGQSVKVIKSKSVNKSNPFQWKGCLRSLNVRHLFWSY